MQSVVLERHTVAKEILLTRLEYLLTINTFSGFFYLKINQTDYSAVIKIL